MTWLASTGVALALTLIQGGDRPAREELVPVIVQGDDVTAASRAVAGVGGVVTHQLAVIDAVGAELTRSQIRSLQGTGLVKRVYADAEARSARARKKSGRRSSKLPKSLKAWKLSKAPPKNVRYKKDDEARDTFYPTSIGADALHLRGLDGTGVTVAVVDTGIWDETDWLSKNLYNQDRNILLYDAIDDNVIQGKDKWKDDSGHGTHVTSILLSGRRTKDDEGNFTGSFNGVAPGVDIVAVKAFDKNGVGTYRNVIRGIDFVVRNKDVYNIRVLNLSFSAPARSHYWEDPLNQAVMRAWQAGIVVVVSAGNEGPDPMTIGVPGNVPYVITVGAMTDNYTPSDPSDDFLATFSAAGPTAEGFVKPDLLAPGGHMLGLMEKKSRLAKEHPVFHRDEYFFVMSGTSQAAAVVSGAAAILIQGDPTLTPDQVKSRLMRTARPAVRPDGTLAYSVFQQGAGLVNVYDAYYADFDTGVANVSIDVDADLDGTQHYGGPANRDENGNFYLMNMEGDGLTWNGAYLWDNAYLWETSMTQMSVSTNIWVEQE